MLHFTDVFTFVGQQQDMDRITVYKANFKHASSIKKAFDLSINLTWDTVIDLQFCYDLKENNPKFKIVLDNGLYILKNYFSITKEFLLLNRVLTQDEAIYGTLTFTEEDFGFISGGSVIMRIYNGAIDKYLPYWDLAHTSLLFPDN